MLSSVGLEVMNSTNPELNWKTVTKGRRSRKSVARSLNSVVKLGNSISPKRVGDFSESDSDKFGEVVLGQSTSGKSENVPLKKRRHLLQSPPPHPWASSLRSQDSASTRTRSSPFSEDHEKLQYPSCSLGQKSSTRTRSLPFSEDHEKLQYPSCSLGQKSSNWHLMRGIKGSAKVARGNGFDVLCDQTVSYDDAGDFSGIELLAAAASMDDDADKKDMLEDSKTQKNSDASSSETLSKVGDELENSLSEMNVHRGGMDCSQERCSASASKSNCGSLEDETLLKVSRQHWDLNTLMDAWNEPCDDSIAGNSSKDVDDMYMDGEQKVFTDLVCSDQGGIRDESSNLKTEENKSTSDLDKRTCSEPCSIEERLQELRTSVHSNAPIEASEKGPDDKNSIQVLSCDADMKNQNEVAISDVVLDNPPFTKPCCSSDVLVSGNKTNSISDAIAVTQDEDCSSNISECERSTAPDGVDTRTEDVNARDVTASESVIDVQRKDMEDSQETFEPPGFSTQDAQPVADSKKQNNGAIVSGCTIADCQRYLEPIELDTKHDFNHDEELKKTKMEDTCKSSSAGAQCDGRRDSEVSQDNHVPMVDGDDLACFQEGYDSPYEDGELRGSFLCSWEDNEIENECVDYESDGRNGDGSDAADYPVSEIVEGGSEGSHGTRRSLSMKRSPEGRSKSGPLKQSLRKHFVQDDSDNNEIAGKGSNAGSGTTVEQCMEMVIEEDDDIKRRQLIDRRDVVDVKVTDMDEYASKMTARSKLQSRIEGRSSADATYGKDVFFMQQYRPRRLGGSYSRAEREVSPDRYMGRHRSTTAHGERDGVHQWTSWGSRRRFTSNYQGAEGRNHTRPRSKINESADKIGGVDFHDPRPTSNYMPKGLNRPLMRRSSPVVERAEYFGVGRRMPPTRGGVGNYRGRGGGHYSQQRAGRDFVEDYEPLPDDGGAPVRIPRYLSRRERSFSPGVARNNAQMGLPRRRSRSRSRTRSPRVWHSHRERIMGGGRRPSRSPEFRSEARMERMRVPFSKPSFAAEYGGEGYMSPSRGRFSPQRNCRWVDDHNFAERRRRSPPPGRVLRRTQRFEPAGGRKSSDEYFRPVIRPGRFSLMGNGGGRECKLESSYEDRRREEVGEMMHRVVQHSEDGNNVRRFRHNAGDNFETNSMNNEEEVVVRVGEGRGDHVVAAQTPQEEKRASFNI